jgi:hypothetical protein
MFSVYILVFVVSTVAGSNRSVSDPVSTTESYGAKVERVLAQMVSEGKSAEVIALVRKKYERYLSSPSVPTIGTVGTTVMQYSTSTSTTVTPRYLNVVSVVDEIVNTTLLDISNKISTVGSTVLDTSVFSTLRPSSSTKTIVTRVSRLYPQLSSPVNVPRVTNSVYPVPISSTVFSTSLVNFTTERVNVEKIGAGGYPWTEKPPGFCKQLQDKLLEWVNLGAQVGSSSTMLPTMEVMRPTIGAEATNNAEVVLGTNSSRPVHDSWGILPLEGGPFFLITLLVGVLFLGKACTTNKRIIVMTCDPTLPLVSFPAAPYPLLPKSERMLLRANGMMVKMTIMFSGNGDVKVKEST